MTRLQLLCSRILLSGSLLTLGLLLSQCTSHQRDWKYSFLSPALYIILHNRALVRSLYSGSAWFSSLCSSWNNHGKAHSTREHANSLWHEHYVKPFTFPKVQQLHVYFTLTLFTVFLLRKKIINPRLFWQRISLHLNVFSEYMQIYIYIFCRAKKRFN